MGHQDRKVNFRMLAVVSIVLAFNAAALAQSYTPGQPAVANASNGLTTDGVSWDAKQFAGSDMCAQIHAAWEAAMATGLTSATIDARGMTGAQSCASDPFPGNATGKLLLGNAQITTTATWHVPSRTHLEGLGVSQLNGKNTANTTLRAGSSAADPVLDRK